MPSVFTLLSRALTWFERRFGTEAVLPHYAAETTVPHRLLRATHGGAWCTTKEILTGMVLDMLASSEVTRWNAIHLSRLVKWIRAQPDHVTHVILYPDHRVSYTGSVRKYILMHRAMLNHERTHAITLCKTSDWHREVDECMWTWFPDEWDDCLQALLKSRTYSKLLDEAGNDPEFVSWLSSEEIIARIGVMLHAPRDSRTRWFIASQEMRYNPQALYDLTARVEEHWPTAESLISWLDSIVMYNTSRSAEE